MFEASYDRNATPERVTNAIQTCGYLQEYNTSLVNSSIQLLSIGPYTDLCGYGGVSSTYQFTTTDGKTHVCHIDQNTSIVEDVDNESFIY